MFIEYLDIITRDDATINEKAVLLCVFEVIQMFHWSLRAIPYQSVVLITLIGQFFSLSYHCVRE